MPRFEIRDESAGFVGRRLMHGRRRPDDLLVSTDKNFRPVDPQIGPDGALWFGDWCNAIIGHMQYSQRDPNRDHLRGRIFRLVAADRALLEPVTQAGRSEAELLDQLREYESRTRYRARRELADRPTDAVVAAVKAWVAALDPDDAEYDRLRCDALWVLASHHAVDVSLLRDLVQAETPQARAAAMHVVADERDYLPEACDLLAAGVRDEHPRVRLEAIRGLSFFPTLEATHAALAALESPMDSWLQYTLEHALGSQESAWSDTFAAGTLTEEGSPTHAFIAEYIERRRPGLAAKEHLAALLDPETPDETRQEAYDALEQMDGHEGYGQRTFQRVCAGCHRVGNTGYQFGPDLSDVGKRLKRREIIESVMEPSKKVDPKYVTTTLVTIDGLAAMGLVVHRDEDSLTLLMAEGKVKEYPLDEIEEMSEINQSSMPENLAGTMAPTEFLDVIEFLSSLE
jgi:putative heme-binding domain-containing protein